MSNVIVAILSAAKHKCTASKTDHVTRSLVHTQICM